MLLRPLRYVFFRILSWKLRDPRESTPVLVASLSTIVLLFFNLMVVTMLVNGFTGHPLLPPLRGGPGALSALLVFCFIVGHAAIRTAWIENARYALLRSEFHPGDSRIERRRTVLFWSYIALSVALPFLLSIFWPR